MRLIATALVVAAFAAPPGTAADASEASAEADSSEAGFTVVPGPFYNPNQGLGLMIVPLWTFPMSREDTVSPPSLVALPLMYAVLPPLDEADTRYSYMLGGASKLFWAEDRWRAQAVGVYFDVFRRFRGIGGDVSSTPAFDYRDLGAFAFAQVTRQVVWDPLYAGLLVAYTAYRSETDDPAGETTLEALGAGEDWERMVNVGVAAQIDTKNSQYYPSSGLDFNVAVYASPESDTESVIVVPNYKQFFALSSGDRLVLAYQIFAQLGFGDVPLLNYAQYGSRGTTLGYSSGEFVDKSMAGVEGELRWLFWRRLGLEGGFGIGKVFPAFDEFDSQPWLPGGWTSLTYQVMEENDIRARLSLAVGKSEWALYFAVGETF